MTRKYVVWSGFVRNNDELADHLTQICNPHGRLVTVETSLGESGPEDFRSTVINYRAVVELEDEA